MILKILFIFLVLIFNPTTAKAHGTPVQSIHMTPNGFDPTTITVNEGETVLFENLDTVSRWPASNIHPTHEVYSDFDPKKEIEPGKSWEFTFNRSGKWEFHDHLFPQFTGSVVVNGGKEGVEKVETKNGMGQKLKIKLYQFYYKIRPTKEKDKLASLKLSEISRDNTDSIFWIEVFGPRKIMDQILEETDGGSKIDCHNQAHIVGRLSFDVFKEKAFEEGDASCHSGFYHGAMESFLSENGTENLATDIQAICKKFPTEFGYFECLHGIGHGVMAYESYDLNEALKVCTSLPDSFAQSSCYGGVFMENIVASQGNPADEGHSTAWVSSDPHYPCNSIDQSIEIQTQCYLMQTSRMLGLKNGDIQEVARECTKAPEKLVETCFQSLGRDIAGLTLRNPVKILSECAKSPNDYYPICIQGALNVILDFWGNKVTNQGIELCSQVRDPLAQNKCLEVLTARIPNVFGNSREKLTEICNYEPSLSSQCLTQGEKYFYEEQ